MVPLSLLPDVLLCRVTQGTLQYHLHVMSCSRGQTDPAPILLIDFLDPAFLITLIWQIDVSGTDRTYTYDRWQLLLVWVWACEDYFGGAPRSLGGYQGRAIKAVCVCVWKKQKELWKKSNYYAVVMPLNVWVSSKWKEREGRGACN